MDTALIVAFIAVGITSVSSIVDFIQTWHIRKVQTRLDSAAKIWEQNGTFGEQINAYLLAQEAPDKPTNLDILAGRFGQAFYASLRSGNAAALSVESRQMKAIDKQIINGAEDISPEISIGMKILSQLGFDVPSLSPEQLGYALNKVKKMGILPGGNMQQSESKPGW